METRFPIPILEVIAKLTHLTANSDIKQNVAERSLDCSAACVVNGAKVNPGGDRRAIGQSRIGDRERIKRICNWHTDAAGTKGITVRLLEWIVEKPSSRPGSIKK